PPGAHADARVRRYEEEPCRRRFRRPEPSRNLAVYGLGGLIAPFIGIKVIDLLISLVPGL
ncbi:hypothetical protein, partial [Streptomyces minutiscleroticus]|uniref:hypothetical protein n=1 Tax=Streptomyces minutiscleroticus TaxID=68238 RepID=UPI00332A53A9